ncbi:MAG: hypothetical protein LC803_09450 [Acidobacteria bacterium]|nr:hypothetical protein [Acidobacteriota bacterium]
MDTYYSQIHPSFDDEIAMQQEFYMQQEREARDEHQLETSESEAYEYE